MKPTTNQTINRVFAAVCGFQIVKGGGGGGYNSLKGACIRGFSALSAAVFAATIQKIIIAAAVVFSAGLSNISANAQQAEFRIYTPISMVTVFDSSNTFSAFDASGSVQNVLTGLRNHIGGQTTREGAFGKSVNDVIYTATEVRNGLPYYGDNAAIAAGVDGSLDAGDLVLFRDPRLSPAMTQLRIFTRIYNTGGTDLFIALGEETPVTSSSVSGDEFFIRSDTGELMTTPHIMNIGYQLTCDPATPIMETDGLSCREIESAADCPGEFFNNAVSPARCDPIPNCGTGTTGTANAQNECECATEGDVFVSGSNMQMCETPPATPPAANCGDNAINDPNDNTMCVCENTETHEFVDGSTTICEPITQDDNTDTGTNPPDETQNPPSQITPQNRADNKKRRAESINTATGLLAVGVIAVFLAGGVPSFNMSPDFGYSITESGYYANVGGRADFRKDNWHLYYSANQTNANGEFADFRYTSGGRYNGDLFAAAFSESVAGETANYNFSLSADVDGRLVDFSPVYRLHSEYDKGEFSTRNELNLQSNFHYDGWTINSSAGFRWENANDFSENARFQINAIHRF